MKRHLKVLCFPTSVSQSWHWTHPLARVEAVSLAIQTLIQLNQLNYKLGQAQCRLMIRLYQHSLETIAKIKRFPIRS